MPVKNNKNRDLTSRSVIGAATNKKLRYRIADWLVNTLYGQAMHVTSYSTSLVAATVVFWYQDGGMRKFLMVRDVSNPDGDARFPGCLESKVDVPISETLISTIGHMLGTPFTKAFDHNLLEQDRVCAAPVLSMKDKAANQSMPVQGIVWLIQVTKEQAQLCSSQDKRIEVIAVPEHSMSTKEVNPAHKVIFQSIERHLNQEHHNEAGMIVDRLEEFLKKMGSSHKQLH